jgi:hypothetical protein
MRESLYIFGRNGRNVLCFLRPRDGFERVVETIDERQNVFGMNSFGIAFFDQNRICKLAAQIINQIHTFPSPAGGVSEKHNEINLAGNGTLRFNRSKFQTISKR